MSSDLDFSNAKTVATSNKEGRKAKIKFAIGEMLLVSISNIESLFPLLN